MELFFVINLNNDSFLFKLSVAHTTMGMKCGRIVILGIKCLCRLRVNMCKFMSQETFDSLLSNCIKVAKTKCC